MKLYHSAGDKNARITFRICGSALEKAKNNEIYTFIALGALLGLVMIRVLGMKMPPVLLAALAALAVVCFVRLLYYLFRWSSINFIVKEKMDLQVQISPMQIMLENRDRDIELLLFKNGYTVKKLEFGNEIGYICTGRSRPGFSKIVSRLTGKTVWFAGRMQVMIVPDPNQHSEAIAILEHIYKHKNAQKLIKDICKECKEECVSV